MRSRIAFHGVAHNANTFLPKYRRSISPTRAHKVRATTNRIRDPLRLPLSCRPSRGLSRTYNKQCRSCTQWRRNVKNRSARSNSTPRPALQNPTRILLLKAHQSRPDRHHKVKGLQWLSLRGTAVFCRYSEIVSAVSHIFREFLTFRSEMGQSNRTRIPSERRATKNMLQYYINVDISIIEIYITFFSRL